MKKHVVAWLAMLFLAFPAFAVESSVPSSIVAPPETITGRWYGPDRFIRSHSQRFELRSINVKTMTATATYWSNQSRCNKANIPLVLTSWDGKTLEWRLANQDDAPMCLSTLSGSLTIGQSESLGQLITGGATYSVVDLVMQ